MHGTGKRGHHVSSCIIHGPIPTTPTNKPRTVGLRGATFRRAGHGFLLTRIKKQSFFNYYLLFIYFYLFTIYTVSCHIV